jgi:hypothetical protein
MLTVAATTKITIQKAKLAVINARRSSKYKIKYMIFFQLLNKIRKLQQILVKTTPIANSTKIHRVGTEILHPERGKQTDRYNEANRGY